MSRNGRIPINIPEKTQVRIEGGVIFARVSLENCLLLLIMMQKLR